MAHIQHGRYLLHQRQARGYRVRIQLEPIVVFDLSRTQADKIEHIYSDIENLGSSELLHTALLAD